MLAKENASQLEKGRIKGRKWRAKNPERQKFYQRCPRRLAIAKLWTENNREKNLATRRAHYLKNRAKLLEGKRQQHIRNLAKIGKTPAPIVWKKNLTPEQYKAHRQSSNDKFKARYPERVASAQKKWQQANKAKMRAGHHRRYHNNPQVNIASKCRKHIRWAIKTYATAELAKSARTNDLLGCSYAELKLHIESLFTEGMNWDKVLSAEIHLDHKRPVCSFDLTQLDQRKLCFNYKNLQPLWALDNLKKHAKYNPDELRGA